MTNQHNMIYRCPECGAIGAGNRFVQHHLQGCKGTGRRAAKNMANGKYAGREHEAMINTAVYNANKMIEQERQVFLEMKARIEADIERIKSIGHEFQEKPIF